MSRFSALLIVIGLVLMAELAWPTHAAGITIQKKDGTQITGDLLREDATSLTLRLPDSTIPLRINRDEIQEIRDTPSVAQQYRQRRSQLKDEDLPGRYELAKWLYDQRELVTARRELLDLRRINPDDERVKLLLNAVEEQLKASAALAAAQSNPAASVPAAVSETGESPGAAVEVANLPGRLTPEQINLIRVYEYDSQSRPPLRVQIPPSVFDAIFTRYRNDPRITAILGQPNGPNLFRSKPGSEILEFLFQLKARELYDQVWILDDPPAMRTFRTQIHQSYVLNYCATDRCHGGKNNASQSFFLFRNNPWDAATAYTNFYLLHAYTKDSMRMLDRSRPEESLLIQFGLPRSDAQFPHPNQGNWKPHPGLGSNSPLRRTLVNWLGTELLPEKMLPDGTYPIGNFPATSGSPAAKSGKSHPNAVPGPDSP